MGRSVRISEEAALNFARAARLGCSPDLWARRLLDAALARLDRIPKTPKKPRKRFPFEAVGVPGQTVKANRGTPLASRKPSKGEKRDETARIRAVCLERSERRCECGCGRPVDDDMEPNGTPELDHFFGRGKAKQSVETCWILRADCHREKTNNRPDARMWFQKFVAHCGRHGYRREQAQATTRLAYIEARAALPAAPRTVRHV